MTGHDIVLIGCRYLIPPWPVVLILPPLGMADARETIRAWHDYASAILLELHGRPQ